MSNRTIFNEWKAYYEAKGISPEIKIKYLEYIKRILTKNAPIIFNFEHLSLLLGRNTTYLASVVNSPENHYREFKIKKRSSGQRLITSPYPALLEMQNWIYKNILNKIAISTHAHGFATKKSIITNAKIHTNQKQLLKLDLKDFFPSIEFSRIIHVFLNLGYPNIVAFYLASICSYEGALPQGSPTSPVLSNIIAHKLDKRLIALSKVYNLKYTRYADDLTFSGDRIPAILIEYISKIVIDEGFLINNEKTRLYKNKSQRIVTGISVMESEIKLPRDYKRQLRQELHYIFKYSLESHITKKKIRRIDYLASLIGKVTFWLSIEPCNQFALDARNKLYIMKQSYVER